MNSTGIVKPLKAFKDNYIWLIEYNEPYVDCVDPGDERPVLDYLLESGRRLRNIYLTHHHFDHQGGVIGLKKQFTDICIFGPADARIPVIDYPVAENDRIDALDYQFKVIETPGHTSTHICYLDENNARLFCGDTLFSAGCGRVFDGSHQQLYQSLLKLRALEDKTSVYCAHEYTFSNLSFAKTIEPENLEIDQHLQKIREMDCSLPSSIGLEKKINPFLRTDQSTIKQFADQYGIPSSDPFEVFYLLRDLKDKF